jgi:hypothetical protein
MAQALPPLVSGKIQVSSIDTHSPACYNSVDKRAKAKIDEIMPI